MQIKSLIKRYSPVWFFILIILLGAQVSSAARWHNNYNMKLTASINDIICREISTKQLFAAGDVGFVAISNDGGNTWEDISAPVIENLYSIEVSYAADTTLVAVGDAGIVVYSSDFGKTWTTVNINPNKLNSIVFYNGEFWAAGDNFSDIYRSPDGDTWVPVSIADGAMDIVSLISTQYGLYAAANQLNNGYILEYNGVDQFDSFHSELDVQLNSGIEALNHVFFVGRNLLGGEPLIFPMQDLGANWDTPFRITPNGLTGEPIAVNGFSAGVPQLWVSTNDGFIHQSDDLGNNFFSVFSHDQGGSYRSIAVRPNGSTSEFAWAAGEMGLLAKFGMGIEYLDPVPNSFIVAADNLIRIKFSGMPDLISVEQGISIYSSIKGFVPFTANYDAVDTTIVELLMQFGAVPGETFKIIISHGIFETSNSMKSQPYSYTLQAQPFGPGDFDFNFPDPFESTAGLSTNFVMGFFNDDDMFDLITYSQGNLLCYAGDGSGGFQPVQVLTLGPAVAIEDSANRLFDGQLQVIDFNQDGLQDLIIHDDSTIEFFKNQSTNTFDFLLTDNQPGTNLKSIKPFIADRDSTLDLLIIGDQIDTRINVGENTLGIPVATQPNPGWSKIRLGDINADGTEDLAAIDNNNDIYLRRNMPWGGFDYDTTVIGDFNRFSLADMDNDGFLDLVAVENDVIEIYWYIPPWSFGMMATLSQSNASIVRDFSVFDFTGNGLNDVVMVTESNELKIFENQGGFTFVEREDQKRVLDINPSNILYGDFNQTGQLDLVAYDIQTGNFQLIKHGMGAWFPTIDSAVVNNGQVELSWDPFPDPGALAYYRVYRDTIPGTFQFLEDVTINSHIDSTVQQGLTYYYKVEAYDTSLIPSQISNEWMVTIYQTLSGQISGVLADTSVPYLVTDDLEVDQGQLLQIMPGVELLFEAGKSFTVFGRLEATGNNDQFVKFSAVNDQNPWAGIILSGLGDQDTVLLSWFDISEADEGLRIEDRPAKIKYGGITDNNIGINVRFAPNGFLSAENIIITNNQTGIQVSNFASIWLKNVTIANNTNEGVLASDFSAFDIKNAIIWDNNNQVVKGPDIINNTAPDIKIRYSTIDSLAGNFLIEEVSRLFPLFKPADMDSMDFVPDTLSPTIDWGDPADDFSLEPLPNGGRINQGVYGGTPFATPTFQPQISASTDTMLMAARLSDSDSQVLTITNNGNRNLLINNIITMQPEFNSDFSVNQTILPAESIDITISFSPSSRASFSDVIFIDSNDPHYPPPGLPIVLEGTGLNSPPVFTSNTLMNAVQNQPYTATLQATDFDGDPLLFRSINIPSWMVLSADGTISGTPQNTDVGNSIPVVIEAFDSVDGYDTLSTTINVLNVNDPPVINTTTLANATEDIQYVDTVRAIDIDNDNLTFSAVNTPGWLAVKADGALSGTPLNDDVGVNVPVIISVTDGNSSFDTLFTTIDVINTNDAPQISAIDDTIAYALIPFELTLPWTDIDQGDILTYTDDTPLFDIESPTGRIQFTPSLDDTGKYPIEIRVSDGTVSLTETFTLDIRLAPLNPPGGVSITSGDQELTLTWFNPDNLFFTGTVISISMDAPVIHPDSGLIVYDDSTLSINTQSSATITNLEIGQSYYISFFTYFKAEANTRLYSDPFSTVAQTQIPALNFDFSNQLRWVPPEKTLYDSLTVRNDGAGTLIFNFSYSAGALIDRWFEMDTTQKVVAPFDSVRVAFELHPPAGMADIPHSVLVSIDDNDPLDGPTDFSVTLRVLFDRVAPQLQMLSQPDSIYNYSAVRFAFTANDTVEQFGWKIGFPTDSLRVRYKFFKMPEAQLLKEETDLPIKPIDFYPLPDGGYKFELWIYDPEGNGAAASDMLLLKRFVVSTSEIPVFARRWYLASVPREQDVPLPNLISDSTARVFRWDNNSERYRSYNDSTLHAGQSVWILSRQARKLDISALDITQNLDSIEVALEAGWNQIGVPAAHFIDFGKLRFRPENTDILYDIEDAVVQNKIAPAVYWYTSNLLTEGYSWMDITMAAGKPWRGYWVLSSEPGTLIISREPVFPDPDNASDANPVNPTGDNALAKLSGITWQLGFDLSNKTHIDSRNVIGISDVEKGLPVYEPPHLENYCTAYFQSDQGRISRELKRPFTSLDELKEWQLFVSSSSRSMHTLEWPEWNQSSGIYLYLVDNVDEQIIDLSQSNSYEFKMNSEHRRFTIYATQDASFEPKIIPQEFRLLQNYPNPFNPNTTIRFGIPPVSDGKPIGLIIYNMLGQEVATLVDQPLSAGYHEITWDGTNSAGIKVASGIYFYRLTGVRGQLTRKMILLK